MDLITLDAQNHESKLIENYDSLIWTERYNTVGDFQLLTGNIDQFMEALPEGTVVSLRETTVPMIVETHEIVRKKNAPEQLKITGRDYCSVLDRRVAIQGVVGALGDWKVVAKIPSDVAHYIIYKICVEGILDAKDIFPGDKIQFITPDDYLESTGPNREFTVSRAKLLTAVVGLLQTEAREDPTTTPPSPAVVPHGIRAIRPNSAGTAIGIQIYVGTDRSADINFDATRDLLDDGRYLFSKVGSATDAYLLGATGSVKMAKGDGATGLDRRVILVDGTTSGSDSLDALKNEGARALSLAHETALFDGSINEDLSPYTYNVDYFLGDIVRTEGDYGLDTKSRVTEYIRSEDATGSKAYPTLSAIAEEGDLE
jgi:hypothetical protein